MTASESATHHVSDPSAIPAVAIAALSAPGWAVSPALAKTAAQASSHSARLRILQVLTRFASSRTVPELKKASEFLKDPVRRAEFRKLIEAFQDSQRPRAGK